MDGYEAKITYSSRELSAKERIRIKDFTHAVQLDDAILPEQPLVIDYDFHVIVSVHNEHAKGDNKDYTKTVICDKAGNAYITGSESFTTAMDDILDEMNDGAPDEDITLECYKVPSKNFQGKCFLTCTIV